jgi:RHH-type transcriptional regulator, rel operon repressor / antitoxin RelB
MSTESDESREFADLDQWQVEEIKKAIDEADRGEFASDQEVEQVLKRWTRGRPAGNC